MWIGGQPALCVRKRVASVELCNRFAPRRHSPVFLEHRGLRTGQVLPLIRYLLKLRQMCRSQDDADILPYCMKAGDVDLHKAAKWLLHVGQDLGHNLQIRLTLDPKCNRTLSVSSAP